MREAIDGYAVAMLRFIEESYGKDAVQQAWLEFTMGASEEFVPGAPNTELFFSWLFHHWKPGSHKGNQIADLSLNDVVPTRAYLDRRGALLSPLLGRYLETCLADTLRIPRDSQLSARGRLHYEGCFQREAAQRSGALGLVDTKGRRDHLWAGGAGSVDSAGGGSSAIQLSSDLQNPLNSCTPAQRTAGAS